MKFCINITYDNTRIITAIILAEPTLVTINTNEREEHTSTDRVTRTHERVCNTKHRARNNSNRNETPQH
jgi:phage terminase large subunit GpA-like protein